MFTEKLTRGGFGPTAINNRRNLRLNWEQHDWAGAQGFRSMTRYFK